jgi:hypothetical protein
MQDFWNLLSAPTKIKDHEEIFYKVTNEKEIENLKSWFTGYYEFAGPLTETMIQEYERSI